MSPRVELPELAAAVAALPEATREDLARGPLGSYGGCNVCRSLRRLRGDNEPEPGSPGAVIWAWHCDHDELIARGLSGTFREGEPGEKDRREAERLWGGNGPLCGALTEMAGALSYFRCLTVYLLAGWRPGAEEPLTDDKLVELVRLNPGKEAWELHDAARARTTWDGTSVGVADRLRALMGAGRLRWEESESRALWYVA